MNKVRLIALLGCLLWQSQPCGSDDGSRIWRVVGDGAVVLVEDGDSVVSAREIVATQRAWYFLSSELNLRDNNRWRVRVRSSGSCDQPRFDESAPDVMLRCKQPALDASPDDKCAGMQGGFTLGLFHALHPCSSEPSIVSLDVEEGWVHLEEGAAACSCNMAALKSCEVLSLLVRGNFFEEQETSSIVAADLFYEEAGEETDVGAKPLSGEDAPQMLDVSGDRAQQRILRELMERGEGSSGESDGGQCHCFDLRDVSGFLLGRSFILAVVGDDFFMASPSSVRTFPAVTADKGNRRRTWYITNGLFVIDAPGHSKFSLPVSLLEESIFSSFIDFLNTLTTASDQSRRRHTVEPAALTCFDERKLETQGVVHAGRLLELFLRNKRQHESKEEDEGGARGEGGGGTGRGESIVGLWRKRKRNADKIIETETQRLQAQMRRIAIQNNLIFEVTIIPIEAIESVRSDHGTDVEIFAENRSMARLNVRGVAEEELKAFHGTLLRLLSTNSTMRAAGMGEVGSSTLTDGGETCIEEDKKEIMADIAQCVANGCVNKSSLPSSSSTACKDILAHSSLQHCILTESSSIALVSDALVLIKYDQSLEPCALFCLPVMEMTITHDRDGVHLQHRTHDIHLPHSAISESYDVQKLLLRVQQMYKESLPPLATTGKEDEFNDSSSHVPHRTSLFRSTGFSDEREKAEFNKLRSDILSCIGLQDEKRKHEGSSWLSFVSNEYLVYCVGSVRRCCNLRSLSSITSEVYKSDVLYILQEDGTSEDRTVDHCSCNITVNSSHFHVSELRSFFDLLARVSGVHMIRNDIVGKDSNHTDVIITTRNRSNRRQSSENTTCQLLVNTINNMAWNKSTMLLTKKVLHATVKLAVQVASLQQEACSSENASTCMYPSPSLNVSQLLNTSVIVDMQLVGDHQILLLHNSTLVFIKVEHAAAISSLPLLLLSDIRIDERSRTFDFLSLHVVVFSVSFLRFQPQRLYLFLYNLRSSIRSLQLEAVDLEIPPSLRTSELLDFLRRREVSEEYEEYCRRRELNSAWSRCQQWMEEMVGEEGDRIVFFLPSRRRLVGLTRKEVFLADSCGDESKPSIVRFELAEVKKVERDKGRIAMKNVRGETLMTVEEDEYNEEEKSRLLSMITRQPTTEVKEATREEAKEEVEVKVKEEGELLKGQGVGHKSQGPGDGGGTVGDLLVSRVGGRATMMSIVGKESAVALLEDAVLLVRESTGEEVEVSYEEAELASAEQRVVVMSRREETVGGRFEIEVDDFEATELGKLLAGALEMNVRGKAGEGQEGGKKGDRRRRKRKARDQEAKRKRKRRVWERDGIWKEGGERGYRSRRIGKLAPYVGAMAVKPA
ncbi:hypothetical protein GUITHDRAFT_145318 [Guillardia theta CCMP2712]|uniref:Uncharacterized protein n=1 Tax=Guillardia theta (strain CCMP2712) TaxID=905079 RepID=L1IMC4_GUITC|nr:hypothetical protein GUITHDRAFT_145318 [Guillardia theta CCMP2712]EKX36945.1 hypothetical protein GUITHDRAFT_145318 [Guillardia theta CCMP2712]|eukprot:XP_005823925.1 hypothetical protein GUITHDRAFT_145318 [Guillardia theta CCMP2712]